MHEAITNRLLRALVGKPIVGNAFRGTLVEAIVAEAIEPQWRWCADGWGSFDFEGPGGLGLEVKQSAARQQWHVETSKPCSARFDIAERTGFWTAEGAWVVQPGRAAAVYTFAYHPLFEITTADHRMPDQWEFYVVSTINLPRQKSISLTGVRSLTRAVRFEDLLDAVNAAAAAS
jgi:hypothetical protein